MSTGISFQLRPFLIFVWMLFMHAATCGMLVAQAWHKDDIDLQVSPYLEQKIVVGLCVGIIKSGETQVYGYGRILKESPAEPDGNTLYEIGSISKVFTGILLADAVERGKVQLDTHLVDVWPGKFPEPHPSLNGIQLHHLATHASGLPRMPGNLNLSNSVDPYGA